MSDYDTIKALEAKFPLPEPVKTLTVGTWNGADGTFEYAVPTYTETRSEPADPTDPGDPGKPTRVELTGGLMTALNTFALKLRFNAINVVGDLRVSTGAANATAPAAQGFVEIDAGDLVSVNFSLRFGNQRFRPELPLKIDRRLAGAGAITIPALPVCLVYAPPMDRQRKNTASWSQETSTGSTTSIALTTSAGSTNPVRAPIMIQPWLDAADEMHRASQVLDKCDDPYIKAVGDAFGVISGLLGTSENTELHVATTADEKSITITKSSTMMASIDPAGGGPGHADNLLTLLDARVCWYTTGGPVKLALVGWEATAAFTPDLLKKPDGMTGLNKKTRDALLALNPFVPDPAAIPPSPRFVAKPAVEPNAPNGDGLEYTLTQTDLDQSVETQMDVEDDTASLLAFANIGVPTTEKLQWSLTQTNAVTTTRTKTVRCAYEFFASPDEFYKVGVYFDTVFGTFAYRLISETDELLTKSRTYAIPASDGFVADGGATVSGFIGTGSADENLLASITGWQPNGGSHPTSMFVKRAVQGDVAGVWFRVNFVNNVANGTTWLTFHQGGSPAWAASAQPTSLAFDAQPWH